MYKLLFSFGFDFRNYRYDLSQLELAVVSPAPLLEELNNTSGGGKKGIVPTLFNSHTREELGTALADQHHAGFGELPSKQLNA